MFCLFAANLQTIEGENFSSYSYWFCSLMDQLKSQSLMNRSTFSGDVRRIGELRDTVERR